MFTTALKTIKLNVRLSVVTALVHKLIVVEINCNRHIELDLNPSANSKLFSFIVYCPISNHVTIPLRIVSHVVNQKRLEHL